MINGGPALGPFSLPRPEAIAQQHNCDHEGEEGKDGERKYRAEHIGSETDWRCIRVMKHRFCVY